MKNKVKGETNFDNFRATLIYEEITKHISEVSSIEFGRYIAINNQDALSICNEPLWT